MADLRETRGDESEKRLGGRNPKSNFSQTCALLSRFLNHKRRTDSVDHSSLMPATMNFSTNMENLAQSSPQIAASLTHTDDVPTGIFGFDHSAFLSNDAVRCGRTGEMTIFYGGRMVVFKDLPEEKASEMMAFASDHGSSASEYDKGSSSLKKKKKMGGDGIHVQPHSQPAETNLVKQCHHHQPRDNASGY